MFDLLLKGYPDKILHPVNGSQSFSDSIRPSTTYLSYKKYRSSNTVDRNARLRSFACLFIHMVQYGPMDATPAPKLLPLAAILKIPQQQHFLGKTSVLGHFEELYAWKRLQAPSPNMDSNIRPWTQNPQLV